MARLHVGLPGPFSVSVGGRRRRRSGSSVLWLLFGIALLVSAGIRYPVFGVVAAIFVVSVIAARRPRRERVGWKKIESPIFPTSIPTDGGSLIREPLEAQTIAFDDIKPAGAPVRRQVQEDDPGPKLWVPKSFLDKP
jgi:hypothetical protein